MPIACYMIRLNGRGRRSLRRYSALRGSPCPAMPGEWSYHHAESLVDVVDDPPDPVTGCWQIEPHRSHALFPPDDPRWPRACTCGYVFAAADEWQVNVDHLYVDDAGTEHSIAFDAAAAGMMWE